MPIFRISALILGIFLISGSPWVAAGQEPLEPVNKIDNRPAHPNPMPAVAPPNRPAIGLALEGAAALGLAHIGVIQWLEEHHIPVDRIAGTSMGALVGGLYASGHSVAEMRALAASDAFTKVFTLQAPYKDVSFRRRQDRRQTPATLTLGLARGVNIGDALIDDKGVDAFLTTSFSGYTDKDLDFDHMPIPFRCVATDLTSSRPLTLSSGPLPQAVRASISLPGIFPPVQSADGHFLVDGGILNDLPTDLVKNDLHADFVIAVRFVDPLFQTDDVASIVGILNRSFTAAVAQNISRSVKLADVVITIPPGKFTSTDYAKGTDIVASGYQAAEASRKELLPHALNDADWAAYLAARRQRIVPQPGILRQVLLKGGTHGAQQQVLNAMKPLEGQPLSTGKALNALKPVESDGVYEAAYETFTLPRAVGSASAPVESAATTPESEPHDTGILVHLSKDRTGPPYLLIAPSLAAETSNITRSELSLRVVDQNLGGYGSELRANAQVGYMTNLNAEYYRVLTPSGFFVQPSMGIVREPVYIWENQKRIAERLQQNLDAGLELGRTIGRTVQVSAEWRAEDTRWSLTTGIGGGPYLSGTAQQGLLHLNIDKEESGTVSPSGFRLNAAVGAFYHAEYSANAPLAMLSAARTWLWKDKNIFGLTADANSYFRANVAEPYRFTLGGPRRLSASAFDEYRGTDTTLGRAVYLRKLASMPLGLGEGIYSFVGYEAGEVWSPETPAFLRQDGTAGVVAATPLGSISVGGAVGDAGHRKFFITVGRLF